MKTRRRRMRWGYLGLLLILLGAEVEVALWFLSQHWRALGTMAWVYLAAFAALALALLVHVRREARPRG